LIQLLTNCLQAKNVEVVLSGNVVLKGINIQIVPGQIIGILGPNGSGKTTLLRTLTGMLKPKTGVIKLNGKSILEIPSSKRARIISYLSQFSEMHPFSVMETVLMGRYVHMGRFEIEGKKEVDRTLEVLERVGIFDLSQRKLNSISGGERQLVLLARLLVQGGEYILMDEPMSGLDIKYQIQVTSLIKEERDKRAAGCVMVMHDINLAAKTCDQIFLIKNGKMHAYGTPKKVLTESNIKEVFSVNATVHDMNGDLNIEIKSVSYI